MKLYHNPRCRKSREGLQLLEENGCSVEIIEYMKAAPSESELLDVLDKLGMKAEELVRKTEAVYKEKFKGKKMTNAEWVSAMVKHPQLIQRPILVGQDKAVIGRPAENFHQLI